MGRTPKSNNEGTVEILGNSVRRYVLLSCIGAILRQSPQLTLPDDDEIGGSSNPNMGTIELRVIRARVIGRYTGSGLLASPVSLHTGPISEKSKKAGWHQVAYVFDFRIFYLFFLEHGGSVRLSDWVRNVYHSKGLQDTHTSVSIRLTVLT